MLSFVLKSLRPTEPISSPTIRIVPLAGSTKRNKAHTSVDFKLPVLPTIPTLVPYLNVQVIPLRTSEAAGRYLI